MAGYVTNPATKLEDPTPIHSWVMSYNVFYWLPENAIAATAHEPNHVTDE